ncbi:MAG: thioredoxin family protein [Bacteroidales bacterium]
MDIKILGTGCAKCKNTTEVVKRVVEKSGIEATITKVEDIMEIMQYNVMSTPAIVVDGVIKIKGRVPSEEDVRKVLGL